MCVIICYFCFCCFLRCLFPANALFPGIYGCSGGLSKYTRVEGDNLLVRCNATESTNVDIVWQKNDTKHPFTQNGTDLMLFNINRTLAGQFVCYAINTSYPEVNETNHNVTIDVITVDVECNNFTYHNLKSGRKRRKNKQNYL